MSHLVIRAALVARTALHMGGGRSTEGVDALLRRNAAGQVFIPGSAVGGPLRALATGSPHDSAVYPAELCCQARAAMHLA